MYVSTRKTASVPGSGCRTQSGSGQSVTGTVGGPQGELAAACRYFTQGLSDDDPGRKDMLMNIATEELSHLEIIGTLVGMLNKGAKGALAEGGGNEAELYRSMTENGNDSHITSLLYGATPR